MAVQAANAVTSYVPNCLGGYGYFSWGYIQFATSTTIYVTGDSQGLLESHDFWERFFFAADNAYMTGGTYKVGDGSYLYGS